MRRAGTISVFDYAASVAILKGIPVVAADASMAVLDSFKLETGFDILADNPFQSPHYPAAQTLREQEAAKTVLDYAVVALPTLGTQKPTYAVLWGALHFGQDTPCSDVDSYTPVSLGVPSALSALGLQVETRMLPNSTRERRAAFMAGLTASLPDFPATPEGYHSYGAGEEALTTRSPYPRYQ